MKILEKTSSILERLFDFRGEAKRGEFFLIVSLGLLYFFVLVAAAIAHLYWLHYQSQNFVFAGEARDALFTPTVMAGYVIWGFFATAGLVAVFVAQVFAGIRRLNDLKLRRWLILFGLVPVVNLVFLVFLMFVPADDGLLKKTNRTTAQTPEPSP